MSVSDYNDTYHGGRDGRHQSFCRLPCTLDSVQHFHGLMKVHLSYRHSDLETSTKQAPLYLSTERTW